MPDYQLEMSLDEYLPLRDVVFKTLRQAILAGELKPGERLMEIHLANHLGVSRTPIREAIRMLELEGLVMMVPRKGAEVSRISKQDISDVLEVRSSLDALAVRLACERITSEELQKLEKAFRTFKQSVRLGDLSKVADADVEFHNIITHASKNKRLVQMVNHIAERIYRYRIEYIKDTGTHAQLIEEHEAILNCVKAGDEGAAEQAILNHIRNQEQSIINQLEE